MAAHPAATTVILPRMSLRDEIVPLMHGDVSDAAFVRFMERGRVDDLERVLEMLAWTNLNEFKRPRLPR